MNTLPVGASAARIFSSPIGPHPVLEQPERGGIDTADLIRRFDAHHVEVKGLFGGAQEQLGKVGGKLDEHSARLMDIEQKLARRGGGAAGGMETKSWGQSIIESDGFKALAGSASQRGKVAIEVKNITTATDGGLVAPDYRVADPVILPRRQLRIRQLLGQGVTTSNLIYFFRQTARTNNAATVAEGATKPQSDITGALVSAPVQVIAHFMKASRQILDDAPGLRSLVDGELRYGLGLVEENQLLNGDGTGTNLLGLIPQATAFSAPFTVTTGSTNVDTLLEAIAQAELANLPATGMVLNSLDWNKLLALKDSMGRYLSDGPFGGLPARTLWEIPVAVSNAMTPGQFLVGNFDVAAQIFDRMEVEVLLSTEDSDNFQRNLVTVRAEERLALAVKQPLALIAGTLPV